MQVFKIQQQSTTSRQFFAKRLSSVVAREARRAATRTKNTKDVQTRAKRVMREMQMFLRGNEKREREARKKAEKEALEKARREEEVREAKRQARKLNFLITQTELYSHFVGSKIKSAFLVWSLSVTALAPDSDSSCPSQRAKPKTLPIRPPKPSRCSSNSRALLCSPR